MPAKKRKPEKAKRLPPIQHLDYLVTLEAQGKSGRLERIVAITDFDPRRAAKAAELQLMFEQGDEADAVRWTAVSVTVEFSIAGQCGRCGGYLLAADRKGHGAGGLVCDSCER